MIIVISPAKRLQMPKDAPQHPLAVPMFFKDAIKIVSALQNKGAVDLKKFLADKMGISDKLAVENCERYLSFQHDGNIGTPAVLTFAGDTFQGLKADAWQFDEAEAAHRHLYILSGLYGLLKPFDIIQPYRMEMGIDFSIDDAKNLYQFWQEKITAILQTEKNVIINCASQEYSAVIRQPELPADFITIDFKIKKNNQWRSPGMMIKKYRGQMANALIKKMVGQGEPSIDDIKHITIDGFQFSQSHSNQKIFCFVK
ncbi:MAG: YaaA family protein [Alphaproteobacteria bacterium]